MTQASAHTHTKYSEIAQVRFEHLDSTNGLNQNSITQLFMDNAGMLWIGTQDGIHSYNGVEFRKFLKDPSSPTSISENYITDIHQSSDGALWVGTFNGGLNRLDLKTQIFTQFGSIHGLTEERISHLTSIGDSIWIGTPSGLYMLNQKTQKVTTIPLGNSIDPSVISLASVDNTYVIVGTKSNGTFAIDSNSITRLDIPNTMQVNDIQADSLTQIWLAIDDQIWKYDIEEHKKTLIWQAPLNNSQFDHHLHKIVVKSAEDMWVASDNSGLISLHFSEGKWKTLIHKHQSNKPNSLSGNNITAMLLDKHGTLWLGMSYSGIDRLNIDNQYFLHLYDNTTDNARISNMVRTIYRDTQDRVWMGMDGGGLKFLDKNHQYQYLNKRFAELLNVDIDALALTVNDILQDGNGLLWFATNLGVFTLDDKDNLSQVKPKNPALHDDIFFRSLTIDDKNRVWLASSLGLYFISRGKNEMLPYNFGFQKAFSPFKYRIIASTFHEGYLWLGTLGGVVRLDPDNKQLEFFTHDPSNPHTISDDRVRDFLVTSNGDFWLATHGGMNKLTSEYGIFKFERIVLNDHELQNTVYAMLEDNQGDIWLSTNDGLARYSPTTQKYATYNIHEGLQSSEFNGGSRFKDSDGNLWFGGINGVNYFDPSVIPASRDPIKLALTQYHIGETQYSILDLTQPPQIEMPYEKQLISFEVGALNYRYHDLNNFRYRLTGFDTVWHKLAKDNKITYTNLPPGDYQLVVQHAVGGTPTDKNQLNVDVKVIPPLYLSNTAYMIYGIVSFLLLTFFMYSRHKKQEKQNEFEQSIRASEERLTLALWASGDGMWDWNIKEDKVYRTNMVPNMTFIQSDRLLIDSIHPEDQPRVKAMLQEHLDGNSEFFEAEYRVQTEPNKWSWLLDRGQVVERDVKNAPVRMAGTHKDITSRKETENELKLSSQVLFSMNEAVVVGELDYRILSVNPAFGRITGFKSEEVIGKHFLFLAMGKQPRAFYESVEAHLLRHKHWAGEINIRTRNRKGILAWLEINQVHDNKGETSHFVAVFTDITARKKAEEDLRVLANFDPLTGLPNRTLFQDRLNQAITKAHRNEQLVALFFLDLDRFKHINDSMGHHIGDLLLKAVSQRLQDAVREGDTVARLGGDEFTVILEGINRSEAVTLVAEKVLKAFEQPFLLDDKHLTISPSIGISLYPNDAEDASSLIKYADTAMYHAKSLGRNNFQFYTSKLNEYAMRHVQLEAGLKQAISKNELSLVYQPKYDITGSNNKIVGLEALLRWHSEELGFISPGEFIPLAEETGMINEIGHWAINQACQQLSIWHEQGHTHISVAVNLSARQLKEDIIPTIEVALAVSGLPASSLELELTESMIMGNPADSVKILTQLKAIGLTISVDDFGTGYSSLSYLKRFPIDTLKIDREFVRDITEDPDDAAITGAIITLAHSLELAVVAEGVETQEQLDFLRKGGCDQVQGFLLSKPLNVAECSSKLQQELI